jgi:antitoxin VapB
MATTRVFKAGNSQAIRIPQSLAYGEDISEVEVERHGDTLVIQPRRTTMAALIAQLDTVPKPVAPRARPEIDWPERARSMPERDGHSD